LLVVAHRILVINPTSSEALAGALVDTLRSVRVPCGAVAECLAVEDGPHEVESDEDIRVAAPRITTCISRNPGFDAYVIAAYSQPGLAEARTIARSPVFGIQESAVTLCAGHARRFGVLTLGRQPVQRHIAYIRQLGLQDYHAGERSLEIDIDQALTGADTLDRIVENGRLLINEDGAENLIFGCAGLAAFRDGAQRELGVPVIDPVIAAVTIAAEMLDE